MLNLFIRKFPIFDNIISSEESFCIGSAIFTSLTQVEEEGIFRILSSNAVNQLFTLF